MLQLTTSHHAKFPEELGWEIIHPFTPRFAAVNLVCQWIRLLNARFRLSLRSNAQKKILSKLHPKTA